MKKYIRWSAVHTNAALGILFFLLGSSWLLAPFVHHARFGHLYYISNYEGFGQIWSWAFRLGDILSALIFAWLIVRYRVWRQDKFMTLLLYVVTALAAVDALFALTCQPDFMRHCIETHSLSTDVHDLESSISAIVIAITILWDVIRRRKVFSVLFFLIQILFFVFAETRGISGSVLALLQYLYEVTLLVWQLYVLEAYSDKPAMFPRLMAKPYRTALAVWVGLSGVFAILVSAGHLHLYGRGIVLAFHSNIQWIAEQSAFIGVLMLYLARQIYSGQRRAAYILIAIFGFELVKYSLLEPHPVLAALYGFTFITLFISRFSFVRNTGPVTIHKRLYDLLVVLGGVAVAVTTICVILIALGRFGHVVNVIDGSSDYIQRQFHHHRKLVPLHGEHLRQTLELLTATTAATVAWIVFRPKRFDEDKASATEDRQRAEALLERSARSSEDFFKLWPTDKTYFFGPDGDGFVAYKVVRGVAFALADPVGPRHAVRQKLLHDFVGYCVNNGWVVCFLPVDASSKKLYESEFNLLTMGSSAVINIAEFCETTSRDKWWRWKQNQAVKAGLSYDVSVPPHSQALLNQLRDVSDVWLQKEGRREQSFALGYFDEDYLQACRIHYLTDQAGEVVAFTNELPVFDGRQTTIDLLRYKSDYPAAMPFLLLSTIKQLGTEAVYTTFDLGFVPLAQLDSRSAQLAKAIAKVRFSAAGLEQFKNKFRPDWTPQYLAYTGDMLDLANLAVRLESALKYKQP